MEEHGLEPLEQREAHERMREEHERGGGTVPWIGQLAVATALFAVLAALSGLIANKLAEEALLAKTAASISQNEASDWWAYSQAKSVKRDLMRTEVVTLTQAGAPGATIKEFDDKRKDEIQKQEDGEKRAKAATEERDKHDQESRLNSSRHTIFAGSVTMFQVAIGLAAIAALTHLIWAFAGSLVIGAGGVLAMLWGVFQLLQKTHG